MPTVLTHAVLGWAIARGARPSGARGLGVSFVAAAALLATLADLDVVGLWLGVPYAAPLGHRGGTHSGLFALGISALALWTLRLSGRDAGAAAFVVLFAAAASHPLLDMLTDAGKGCALAAPFSSERFFWGVRPLPTSPLVATPRVLVVLAWEIALLWPLAAAVWLRGSRLGVRARSSLAAAGLALAAVAWVARLSS